MTAFPRSQPARRGWTEVPCTGALQALRRAAAFAKLQLRRGPRGPGSVAGECLVEIGGTRLSTSIHDIGESCESVQYSLVGAASTTNNPPGQSGVDIIFLLNPLGIILV